MVWICGECQKDKHNRCESTWSCDCRCNVGTGADATQKVLTIVGGGALAVGGVALTICTGGLFGFFVGGAMLGGGISATWNGTEKAIKGERVDGKSLAIDVTFGAVAGVATGGVGAVGETVGANLAKQGAKQILKAGTQKLVVRATAGAAAGVTGKLIDEVKQCSVNDKKWQDFGKTFDANGKENGTVTSWITSAAVGGLGGAAGHVSSNLSKGVTSGVAKSATRIVVSGTTAAVSDVTIQGVNIAVGNQDEYDFSSTVRSVASSAIVTAAQEGTKSTVYRIKGGKEQMIFDKANQKLIEEDSSNPKQSLKGYEAVKKAAPSDIAQGLEQARQYTNKQLTIEGMNEIIQIATESQQQAVQERKIPEISAHKEIKDKFIRQKNRLISRQDGIVKPPVIPIVDGQNGQHNIQLKTDSKLQQVSYDYQPAGEQNRGLVRDVYEVHKTASGEYRYKYSGHTATHNYDAIPDYGESRHPEASRRYENYLSASNRMSTNLICNEILSHNLHDDEDEDDRKKHR